MATDGIINGTIFNVYDGADKIAYATNASISINHNLRDTSTKESGGWRDQLEGLRDWEVSVEGMLIFTETAGAVSGSTFVSLYQDYIASRTEFTLTFKGASGDKQWSGKAYLTALSADAPTEDSTTWSATFQGSDSLAMATT